MQLIKALCLSLAAATSISCTPTPDKDTEILPRKVWPGITINITQIHNDIYPEVSILLCMTVAATQGAQSCAMQAVWESGSDTGHYEVSSTGLSLKHKRSDEPGGVDPPNYSCDYALLHTHTNKTTGFWVNGNIISGFEDGDRTGFNVGFDTTGKNLSLGAANLTTGEGTDNSVGPLCLAAFGEGYEIIDDSESAQLSWIGLEDISQ